MIIVQHTHYRYWLGILTSIFLGIIFIIAGISKVFTPAIDIELPGVLLVVLAAIELGVGLWLVSGVLVKVAAIWSLPLIAGFISSNILAKIFGEEECLSCFGAMGKLSIGQALYIDGVMVALVVVILMWYPGDFFNKRPWYW